MVMGSNPGYLLKSFLLYIHICTNFNFLLYRVELFLMLVFYEIVFAHQEFKTKIDNMPRNKVEQIFEPLTLI